MSKPTGCRIRAGCLIAALATAYDLQLIPHGHSVPANVHLIASLPVLTAPLAEFLVGPNS